jgi:GDP-L-fucose synthase
VDDLAQACVMLAETGYRGAPINIGCGADLSIRELAEAVVATVGFEGRLVFDASKPDGMPRKLLDSTRIRALGWRPTVALREGLQRAYEAAPWRTSVTA